MLRTTLPIMAISAILRASAVAQGSGANPKPGQIGSVLLSIEGDSDYAARAACQISGILAVIPPSLPILNCPFLIFPASSMPPTTTLAVR
jgi:hypothetical protein